MEQYIRLDVSFTFTAAGASNSTDQPPLPNSVKWPLETAGSKHFVACLCSFDSAVYFC
jgi:hypothetical protein